VSNSCHFFRTPLSLPWRHAFDACATVSPRRRRLGRAKSESFLGAANQRCDVVVVAVGHTALVEYQLGCRPNQLLGAADHLFRVIWQCALDAVEMALDDRRVLQLGSEPGLEGSRWDVEQADLGVTPVPVLRQRFPGTSPIRGVAVLGVAKVVRPITSSVITARMLCRLLLMCRAVACAAALSSPS
jgi:hypothetical protein